MLIPYNQCLKLLDKKPSGVIHIGAHLGEEAKNYAANRVKRILWAEANSHLMKDLYDNVKMLSVTSQFINEFLGQEDNKESRRFDSYVKEHRIDIDLDKFQFVNIDIQKNNLVVLEGFGEIFKDFPSIKAVYCKSSKPDSKDGPLFLEIDEYLKSFGISRVLTKFTDQNSGDALYIKE